MHNQSMMNKQSQGHQGPTATAPQSRDIAPETLLPPAAPLHMPMQTLEREPTHRSWLNILRHDVHQR